MNRFEFGIAALAPLIQNPKLALLATALPLALRSRWRSLPLGGSVQNPKWYPPYRLTLLFDRGKLTKHVKMHLKKIDKRMWRNWYTRTLEVRVA
jgi:hypothetical protein